jgi:hypothetical protein
MSEPGVVAQYVGWSRAFSFGRARALATFRLLMSGMPLGQRNRKLVMQMGIPIMLAATAPMDTTAYANDLKQGSVAPPASGILYADAVDGEKEVHQMTDDDSDKRGAELRAALQRAYQELADSHQLRGGLHGTDITKVVLPYLPIGIRFSEAEAVLRSAGFVVGPHPDSNPPSNPNRPKDWYAVVASINPFQRRFPSKTSLYISLLPKSPGDYTIVSEVGATFFVSLP